MKDKKTQNDKLSDKCHVFFTLNAVIHNHMYAEGDFDPTQKKNQLK